MARFVQTHHNSHAVALEWSLRPHYQIITPSRRAARALHVPHKPLRWLARKAIESEGKTVASDLAAQRLFRQVVQDVAQPADVLATARVWLPSVRSLLKSDASLSAVSDISSRTATLFKVARDYQVALRREGLIDEAELYWQAAAGSVPPQQVLIYGYFQPSLDELTWIDALATDESVLFLPVSDDSPLFADSQSAVDWLVERGWQVLKEADSHAQGAGGGQAASAHPKQTSGILSLGESLSQAFCETKNRNPSNGRGQPQSQAAQESATPVSTYAYSTLETEVRGTLAQVKALLNSGTPARDIAIVARNEVAYGPLLLDVAWEYDIPLRVLYDTPLLTTRLGAWLALLVDVLNTQFPFEGTARLLSHALASNPDGDFWATTRRQHPQGFAAWNALAQAHLDLNLDVLAQINQDRPRDTWVKLWQDILSQFDLGRRCARWARESVAFNRFRDALRELAKPEQKVLNWADFYQELQSLLASVTVPAQPGRGGVELHSPRSVMAARYAHVFIIGMAEGVLPAPIANDPLLDFFERQQLCRQGVVLPSAATIARQEGLEFYFLLQTVTTSAVFSYPQLEERKQLLPSSYLARLGLQPSPPPSPSIASPEEHRRALLRHGGPTEDGVLLGATHAYGIEQRRESGAVADEYDGVIGIPFDYDNWTFSVSQLQNLGQCPFKWFAHKLLKLGPPEELEEDLSPSQIGQLYHRVLELVLAQLQEDAALELTDPELLEKAFAIAEAEIIPPELPAWSLRRQECLRVLSLTLQSPRFLPAGAKPIRLEGTFSGEWHGLKVRGRVDRIDRTEAGLVLIDYKTGQKIPPGIKDQTGKACIDLQLALYREAAGPGLFADESIADAYYYSIRGKKKMPLPSRAPQHELPAAIERCKAHLETGHYPVQPDKAKSACTYCDFDALCRQGDRISRKEISHGTD